MSEASASRDPLRDAMRDLELVMEWRTDYIRKYGEALDEIARLRHRSAHPGCIEFLAAELREAREENERLREEGEQLGTAVRLLTEISDYWDQPGVTRPHIAEFVDAFLDGDHTKAEPLPWPRDRNLPDKLRSGGGKGEA